MTRALCIGLLLLLASACEEDIPPPNFGARERDFRTFQREVYPVLLRDCGFPTCHGAPDRFFKVWGPGRTRLPKKDPITGAIVLDAEGKPVPIDPFDVPDIGEQDLTIAMAQSMIDDRDPAKSLLLRKPLAVEAGGSGHEGVDSYGRDVYRTTQDSGYVVLARWVLNQTEAP